MLPELDDSANEVVGNWADRSGAFVSNSVYFEPSGNKPELLQTFQKVEDFFSEPSVNSEIEYFEPGDEVETYSTGYAFLEFNEEQPFEDEWEFSLYIFANFYCYVDASNAEDAEQTIRSLAPKCFKISEMDDLEPRIPEVVRVLEINDVKRDISIPSDVCSNCGAGLLRAENKFCTKCGTART